MAVVVVVVVGLLLVLVNLLTFYFSKQAAEELFATSIEVEFLGGVILIWTNLGDGDLFSCDFLELEL